MTLRPEALEEIRAEHRHGDTSERSVGTLLDEIDRLQAECDRHYANWRNTHMELDRVQRRAAELEAELEALRKAED